MIIGGADERGEGMVFNILVVDDEETLGLSIARQLTMDGYQSTWVRSGEEALERLVHEDFQLVFLDLFLPGLGGISVLEKIKHNYPEVLVIILTAYGNIQMAVEAIKKGAFDYLTKSSDLEELRLVVKKALETKKLRKEVKVLRAEIDRRQDTVNLVGHSPKMQEVRHLIKKISSIDQCTVLIMGESGTGKELVARTIHRESPRSSNPFIDISCSALPNSLMETELFGFEQGAFTDAKSKKIGLIELADGGTLFLDEISTLDQGMQAKLLRFLEQRSFRRVGGIKDIAVNISIIAAANSHLGKMAEEGTFRQDLYYRLNVFLIPVPPLRHRKEDISLLAEHFIKKFNQDFHKNIQGILSEAQHLLMEYDYPGNIRELKNIIERAMIMEDGDFLTVNSLDFFKNLGQDLCSADQLVKPLCRGNHHETGEPSERMQLKELEKQYILAVLREAKGNKAKTAQLLGIARSTLFNKIREYNLTDYL